VKASPLLAFLLSVFLHGLIAVGIAVYMGYAPAPDELAQLDLTSVDLSIADMPDETAQAVPDTASVLQVQPLKPIESNVELPPEDTKLADPAMLKPDTSGLPSPLPSPPLAPRQAKVDAPPKLRRNIKPDYPRESRQRGEQGTVTLEIDVNAQGMADDVRVAQSSGYPLLDEAAVKAARSARFSSAKSEGRSVASTARLTLNFKLK